MPMLPFAPARLSMKTLRVGTTHIHARYALLKVIQRFTPARPGVDLEFSQGAPAEILRWVSEGSVDLGISTLPEKRLEGIVALDAYPIDRCLIVPRAACAVATQVGNDRGRRALSPRNL